MNKLYLYYESSISILYKAIVDNAQVQLHYCSIYAPISGRTGTLKIHEGNEIKANDTEVAIINQILPINVVFSIPEKDLPNVTKYMRRDLVVEAFIPGDSRPEKGKLSFLDNSVNPTTGTITLKGAFTNNEKRLWPGQFVNVILTLATQPNAILVPSQAVETGQEGNHVFVIKPDSTAELRPVTTGPTIEGETVILNGVAAGEKVVTDGQMRLVQGTKVEVKASPISPPSR